MPRLNCCPRSEYVYWHTDEAGVVRVRPFPCKSWECPYCGKEKHQKLREALVFAFQCDALEGYHWPCHVILTMNPERISRKEAWATIGKRFDRFRRGLQRDAGGEAPVYARTVDQHEEHDYPHLHLLVFLPRRYRELSKKQLLERLHHLWGPHDGGGFVELGKSIDSQPAIGRVVRYILRHLQGPMPSLPKRGRRVSVSKGIRFWDQEASRSKPPKRDKAGGEARRGNIVTARQTLQAQGYRVTGSAIGIVAKRPRT